jgi:ATP-dependent Zn protease
LLPSKRNDDGLLRKPPTLAVGKVTPQAFLLGTPTERINAAALTARGIDVVVRDILAHAFARASEIFRARRADLDKGAELLLSKETLMAEEYPPILQRAGERATHDGRRVGRGGL